MSRIRLGRAMIAYLRVAIPMLADLRLLFLAHEEQRDEFLEQILQARKTYHKIIARTSADPRRKQEAVEIEQEISDQCQFRRTREVQRQQNPQQSLQYRTPSNNSP